MKFLKYDELNSDFKNTCVYFHLYLQFSLQRMKIHATFALLILALSGEISSCKPSPEDENGLPTIEPDGTTTTEMVPDGSTIKPSSVEPNSTGKIFRDGFIRDQTIKLISGVIFSKSCFLGSISML